MRKSLHIRVFDNKMSA